MKAKMRKLEKDMRMCLKAACETLFDALIGVMMFMYVWDSGLYPRDVLLLELRIAEAAIDLDLLGLVGLIGYTLIWHYAKRVLIPWIVGFGYGVVLRFTQWIDGKRERTTYRG